MKRTLTIVLALVLALGMCIPVFAETEKTNEEWTGTLRITGPGQMGNNPDDSEDLATGIVKPGYNKLIEEFNKDYPNVTIEMSGIPWDNWQAVVQTAAAGGTADILLHGSMLADCCLDLTPYLEKDPEVLEALAVKPEVFRPDPDNYNVTAPTGISYLVSPYYAFLDTKLFEDWGVELPTSEWTYDDLLEIARKMTGTNPVTGEENYGCWFYGNNDGNIWKRYSSVGAAWGLKSMIFDSANKYEATMDFNSELPVKVFDYLNELQKCCPPSYIENMGDDKSCTAENDIAIYLSEGPVGKYNNTVAYDTVDRYVYLPLPVNEVEVEAKYSSFTGTNSIAISKNATDPDLAWEFIKWLVLDEDANDWILALGQVPATYYAMEKLDPEKPYTKVYQEIFDSFWNCFTISQCEVFDTAYGNAISALSAGITGMYTGTYTPQECGDYVQAQITEYQNSYK